jgi:hypothetical protein
MNSMGGTSIQELQSLQNMQQPYDNQTSMGYHSFQDYQGNQGSQGSQGSQNPNYNPNVSRMGHMQQLQQMQYGGLQTLQAEQNHNAAHSIQQAQHTPYYNAPTYGYQRQAGPTCPYNPSYPANDMDELAKDIANNIPSDNNPVEMFNGYTDNASGLTVRSKEQKGFFSIMPKDLRDPIIILVLYVILSQSFVYTFIGKYIKQINPDESGRVSFWGILIYGIILAMLFNITKRYILKI